MKKIVNIFFVSTVLIGLASCERNGMKSKLNLAEVAKDMNSFVYDNYQKGDSLFFATQDNRIDTFVVSMCISQMIVMSEEPGGESNTEDGVVVDKIVSVNSGVYLTGTMFNIEVSMWMGEKGSTSGMRFGFYQGEGGYYSITSTDLKWEEDAMDYVITNALGQTCHVHRGEGLVDFSDEKGNVWTKM